MTGGRMKVLGIDVRAGLLGQWLSWLMPAEQPFLVLPDVASAAGLADDTERLRFEFLDSFCLYDPGDRLTCWLTRAGSRRLPPEVRRAQPAAHRWRSPDRTRDVARAAGTWLQREPSEEWLASACRPGGRDEDAGTVLVWRDGTRLLQHAAVTLGDGWALHKLSQGWMSPTKVLTVRGAIHSARASGHHLERHTLLPV